MVAGLSARLSRFEGELYNGDFRTLLPQIVTMLVFTLDLFLVAKQNPATSQ